MSITVEFVGICTHIRQLGAGASMPRHRVVLVNAGNGLRASEKDKVPPHIPKLIIPPDRIAGIEGYPYGLQETATAGVWRLWGVNLAIEGADDTYGCRDSYKDVPRMSSASQGLTLSSDVVLRNEAACHFDVDAGHFESGKTADGAITSVLTVKTSETPALRVTSFWNGEVSRIRFKPGDTKIAVEHTGYQYGDTDKDYLLHYRVFGNEVPADAFIPPKPKRDRSKPPGSISVACSNSQYP